MKNFRLLTLTTIALLLCLTTSGQGGKDDKMSSNFSNLAVPAGLYYITQENPNKRNKEQMNYTKEHKELPDSIFDSLYEMIEYDDKKKRKIFFR